MTASEFKPTFQQSAILAPDGRMTLVNPMFCATNQCATDLVSLLSDLKPEIVYAGPLWFKGGGGFYQISTVPWLLFPAINGPEVTKDGKPAVAINAGLLASIFNHGYPPALAEQMLRVSITQTIMDMTMSV